MTGHRSKSGSLGFFRFSSPLRSKLCWRECSSYLGGLSGTLGIGSFLKNLLQDAERLFKDEATEEKGERARMASFVGAMAIADLVKTTLVPKGMDKILQSTGRGHSVTVTNNGATILKSLHIDNPAAKVLIDTSKVQDDDVGKRMLLSRLRRGTNEKSKL
ncbi:T-complex protein 1 subunit beta [Tanacetum coccineum]